MRKIVFFFISFWMGVICNGRAQEVALMEIPSLPCIHTEEGKALLKFPGSHDRYDSLYSLLDTLRLQKKGRVNILHVGGSHVQAGYFSHRMRSNLCSLGDSTYADRGLLFPFQAIHTNAPTSYTIASEGEWEGEKCLARENFLPLGLSGASATTKDTLASLSIKLPSLDRWTAKSLRVLGEGSEGVTPYLLCAGDTLSPEEQDSLGYLFALPEGDSICTMRFLGLGQEERYFSLRGILPISDREGITYTESGINGASLPCWLRCNRWEEELSLLPPHLAILGVGINDANVWPQNFDVETFKEQYRMLIRRIQQVSPDCCLLFITNNDCWFNFRGRRKRLNTNTAKVEKAMTELAEEMGGAVFDAYGIMGGYGSSNAWVRAHLQRPDHIHFTRAGYELWGDLLYNALMSDYMASSKKKSTL